MAKWGLMMLFAVKGGRKSVCREPRGFLGGYRDAVQGRTGADGQAASYIAGMPGYGCGFLKLIPSSKLYRSIKFC